MSEKTYTILASCQDDICREETSYPIDMLRWWKGAPICEFCFDEVPLVDRLPNPDCEEDQETIRWADLEPLTIKQARA